jgi:hypothetical protein
MERSGCSWYCDDVKVPRTCMRKGRPIMDAIALDELSLGSMPKDKIVKVNFRPICFFRSESKPKSVSVSVEVSVSYRTTRNTSGSSGFLFRESTLLEINGPSSSSWVFGRTSNIGADCNRVK